MSKLLRFVDCCDFEVNHGVDVLVHVKIGDTSLHDFSEAYRVRLPRTRVVVLLVPRMPVTVVAFLRCSSVALRWLRIVDNSDGVNLLPVASRTETTTGQL